MHEPQTRYPIHLAVGQPLALSKFEQLLFDDGYKVTAYGSAHDLWTNFAERRPRFIIADRRFSDSFSALDLCRKIRKQFTLPYVYIGVLSRLGSAKDVDEALAAGVDDYLIKPHHPLQIRTRVRVGMRWLNYIDSLYRA